MSLNLSNLLSKNEQKRKKRKGRGNASGKGNYSTRGIKGQRSRAGGRKGLKIKGLKEMVHSFPKLGGFRSIKSRIAIVNLGDLESFKQEETIDLGKMLEAGLIKKNQKRVKILAKGKLTKKLYIRAQAFSKGAKEIIEKLGGKAEVI